MVSTMIISKLSTQAQTTVPRSVRRALHLEPGDAIAYEIQADSVVISKAKGAPEPADNPFATFSEWDSEADRLAYANL